jgi:hypothetical protein
LTVAPLDDVASTENDDGTVRVGGAVSCTLTVNEALELFPCASDALQLTVVVVMAKVEPEDGEQFTVLAPETMSFAVGFVKLTLAPEADVASVVMLPGTLLMSGGIESTTVILNVAELGFPCVSVALQVTVCAPSEKVVPDPGLQSELATPLVSEKETV